MEALIHRVVQGDREAWHAFWSAVEPTIWALSGKWQIAGALAARDDERRDLTVAVLDRLREEDFRRLRAYLASTEGRPSSSFKAWLKAVTARVAIDRMRAHPEYDRAAAPPSPSPSATPAASRWVHHTPLVGTEASPTGPDLASVTTAAVLLERARTLLDPTQLAAVHLWIHGFDHEEIATKLAMRGAREADRVVRAALKRLRDRYAEESPPTRVPAAPASPDARREKSKT